MADVEHQVLNTKAFWKNFEGLEDLAYQAIEAFLSSLPSLLNDVKSSVEKKDKKQLEISAHTLKGVVSNFYAETARAIAWELEQIGSGKVEGDMAKLLADLECELAKVSQALSLMLNEKKAA